MRKLILMTVISVAGMVALVACSAQDSNDTAQVSETVETAKVHVYGNCEMCKERIEEAANSLQGVETAVWGVETKILTVSFDTTETSLKQIEEKIANFGHDTENVKATEEVYEKLPGCCQYTRS